MGALEATRTPAPAQDRLALRAERSPRVESRDAPRARARKRAGAGVAGAPGSAGAERVAGRIAQGGGEAHVRGKLRVVPAHQAQRHRLGALGEARE